MYVASIQKATVMGTVAKNGAFDNKEHEEWFLDLNRMGGCQATTVFTCTNWTMNTSISTSSSIFLCSNNKSLWHTSPWPWILNSLKLINLNFKLLQFFVLNSFIDSFTKKIFAQSPAHARGSLPGIHLSKIEEERAGQKHAWESAFKCENRKT